jgi:hypothetical protein
MWGGARIFVLAAFVCAGSAPSIGLAALITTLSTGIASDGGLIAYGENDDQWTVVGAPDAGDLGPATVVPRARSHFVDPEPFARWITPSPATNIDAPAGYYVYETTFTLADGMQSTAQIVARYLADNRLINVTLNGSVAFIGPNVTGAACGGAGCEEFSFFTPFTIADPSLFAPGLNALRLTVENQPSSTNPTQFALDANVFATPVPEPSAALLLLAGLGAGALVMRRGRTETVTSGGRGVIATAFAVCSALLALGVTGASHAGIVWTVNPARVRGGSFRGDRLGRRAISRTVPGARVGFGEHRINRGERLRDFAGSRDRAAARLSGGHGYCHGRRLGMGRWYAFLVYELVGWGAEQP